MTGLLLALLLTGAPRPGILVLDLEGRGAMDSAVVKNVSSEVRQTLTRSGAFEAVHDPNALANRPAAGCDNRCVAQLGEALGAPLVLTGTVGQVGRIWAINLKLLDTNNAHTIVTVSRAVDGSPEDVVAAVPSCVQELLDALNPPAPAPPPTAAPQTAPAADATASPPVAPAKTPPARPFPIWLAPMALGSVLAALATVLVGAAPAVTGVGFVMTGERANGPCGSALGVFSLGCCLGAGALGAWVTSLVMAIWPGMGWFRWFDHVANAITLGAGCLSCAGGLLGMGACAWLYFGRALPTPYPPERTAAALTLTLLAVVAALPLLGLTGAGLAGATGLIGLAPWQDKPEGPGEAL